MATAPIIIRLPGLTGLSLTTDLFAYGGAQNAVAAVAGLTLTADTQQADKFWTTTTAGLSGLYEGLVKESTTIRGRYYILMNDSTNLHHAVSEPWMADIAANSVNADLQKILGTLLTETAGQIAGGFKQFFNVASPTGSVNNVTTIKDIVEADRYIDTSTTPWRLVLIKQGSGTLATGTRLLEQTLKTEAGANVTNISTFIGQIVDVP